MHTRRNLLKSVPLALATPLAAAPIVSDTFPAHPPDLAREMVGASHGKLQRVRELLEGRPALARAAIDWGFGDWEDALGAASHVGNREIAELLIANGARPTIFSAAMFGQLEVVKAFVAVQPGIQRIPGPHSISLLAHAKAGGKAAEPVLAFLESLGDAGNPPNSPLSEAEAKALAGIYTFGPSANDRIEITERRGQLTFSRPGKDARGLIHVGGHAFHPAGARAVRVRFAGVGAAAKVTVHDPDLIVTARRAS